jgi:hypothetical protein
MAVNLTRSYEGAIIILLCMRKFIRALARSCGVVNAESSQQNKYKKYTSEARGWNQYPLHSCCRYAVP